MNYKYFIRYLSLILLFCLFAGGKALAQTDVNTLDLTAEEKAWLSQNKEILVATDPTMAPLEFIGPNGEISGVAGEYLNLFSQILDVKFKWVGNNNWAEGLEKIHSGDAHMVSGANNTESRREFLTFTDSFLNVSHVIFAREGSDLFGDMNALAGRTISQVKGFSVSKTIAKEYPEIIIIEVDTVADALHLVADGVVDAYVGSISIAAYYISEEGLYEITVVGAAPYSGANAMAVRNDLPLFASVMQKVMKSVTVNQKVVLSQKWLALKYEPEENYDLLIRGGIIALAILMAFLFWNYSLRREIQMRKTAQSEMMISQEKARSAQAEAEKASEAKSTFLANMSHELRTPLNAIIGFSDTMSSGVYGKITQSKYQEYLIHIKDSGHHLENVIDDILDLSKIEAGKWQMHMADFSLVECVNSAIAMLDVQAQDKHIDLHIENITEDKILKIYRDESAYKRIIINLLSNAVKFTLDDGVIKCKIEKSDSGLINLSIIDTGIGIAESDLDKVIIPFGQVPETREMNKSGTGLGLPIVKQLVELQNDEFILTSELGKGTKASIIIHVEK